MTAEQAVGYTMLQTTAITALVSTRIYGGTRPDGTAVPCINYFRLASRRKYGMEETGYSINCRAVTANTAIQIARAVVDLWHGTSGTGTYGETGSTGTFAITRASLIQEQPLIFEEGENLYNAPVDITIVYPTGTV